MSSQLGYYSIVLNSCLVTLIRSLRVLDFIEEFESVISQESCDAVRETFANFPNKEVRVPGANSGQEQTFQELMLSDPALKAMNGQLVQHLIPCLSQYLSKYYQILLAGTSLQVYHPKTQTPVALTPDNFEEVGLPQIDVLMKDLFRLSWLSIQKTSADGSVDTCFRHDSHPQPQGDDNLHRILNIALYINDNFESGELSFAEFDRRITPELGKVVIFPSYFTHTYRQEAVESGDRYQINGWLMFNRSEQLYRQR